MRHEKLQCGETCVGNTDKGEAKIAELKKAGIESARLGEQALDIDGKSISPEIWRPLIISNLDAQKYDHYMMTKTFGPGYRR